MDEVDTSVIGDIGPGVLSSPDARSAEDLMTAISLSSDLDFESFSSPADVIGDDAWSSITAEAEAMGPEYAVAALADARVRWNYDTTPSQRASTVWRVGAQRGFSQMYADSNEFVRSMSVDMDNEKLARIRARRNGVV